MRVHTHTYARPHPPPSLTSPAGGRDRATADSAAWPSLSPAAPRPAGAAAVPTAGAGTKQAPAGAAGTQKVPPLAAAPSPQQDGAQEPGSQDKVRAGEGTRA